AQGNNGTYTGNAFLGRSITSIGVNPANNNIIYVSSDRGVRGISSVSGGATANPTTPRPPYGVFKSVDGGNTFSYVFDGDPGCGNVVNSNNFADPDAAHFFRSENAATLGNASFTDITAAENPFLQTINYCTGQCWYDNFVYTPPGFPNTVYLGGSNRYPEYGHGSDGREVMFSRLAGNPGSWSDHSWDATNSGGGGAQA